MRVKIIISIIALSFLISCGRTHSNKMVLSTAMYDIKSTPQTDLGNKQKSTIDKRKLIKKGNLSVEVEDLTSAKNKIEKTIKDIGGYCDNEQYEEDDVSKKYIYKIRVPFDKFELLVSTIENGTNKVLKKEITSEDVTSEFVDNEMRLKNRRDYLQRYNELLKKAQSVKDIIEIQSKIDEIEEEIERSEGMLKYLTDQISYSTLEVSLVLSRKNYVTPSFSGNWFSNAGNAILKGAVGFVDFTIFMLKIWPVWFLSAIIIYITVRIKRKNKRKKITGHNPPL
jgi:hypothetical protein